MRHGTPWHSVRHGTLLLAAAALLSIASCRLPTTNEAAPVVYHEESLTLQWDAPKGDFPAILAPAAYRVYYRLHGQQDWKLLKVVPVASAPEYLLHHDQVGDGSFDFAVSTVNAQGEPSTMHSSLDANAEPFGGLYVLWIYP
jgi:hypothetical protein